MSSKRRFIVTRVFESYDQFEVEAEDEGDAEMLLREEDESLIFIESGYITGGEKYSALLIEEEL